MSLLRSQFHGVLLTILVGLSLVTLAFAQPLPDPQDRAVAAMQAAGLPVSTICGQTDGDKPCADHSCAACLASTVADASPAGALAPTRLRALYAVALPEGVLPLPQRLLLGPVSRGPPVQAC